MTITIKVSGKINRPLEEVFKFHAVDHIQNHPKWDDTIQLEPITGGPIAVGTMIKRIVSRGGKVVEGQMEITEFKQNTAIGARINDGGMEISSLVSYEADGPDSMIMTTAVDFPDSVGEQREMIEDLLNRSLNNIRKLVEG
jgi:hypothetical protein